MFSIFQQLTLLLFVNTEAFDEILLVSRLLVNNSKRYAGSATLRLEDVIAKAEKPCLVVTPSFEDARSISTKVPQAILRGEKETSAEAAMRVPDDGILIATAAWAGLDTPLRWASVVVPRIPFGKPRELDGEVLTHYISSRNLAMRRMRQVVGRGLRTPDSRCDFYICDKI